MTEPAARPTPRPAGRPATLKAAPKRPLHIGTFLGLSAGTYAVALAGVTGLQVATERDVAAARQPATAQVQLLAASHDKLDATIAAAGKTYERSAAAYAKMTSRLSALETRLNGLTGTVSALSGSTAALPTRVNISLPAVTRSAGVVAAPAPATHATTGASGAP